MLASLSTTGIKETTLEKWERTYKDRFDWHFLGGKDLSSIIEEGS